MRTGRGDVVLHERQRARLNMNSRYLRICCLERPEFALGTGELRGTPRGDQTAHERETCGEVRRLERRGLLGRTNRVTGLASYRLQSGQLRLCIPSPGIQPEHFAKRRFRGHIVAASGVHPSEGELRVR